MVSPRIEGERKSINKRLEKRLERMVWLRNHKEGTVTIAKKT